MTNTDLDSAMFKQQVAEEFIAGETVHALSRQQASCGSLSRLQARIRSSPTPGRPSDDGTLNWIGTIYDEFECCGYRWVEALRHQGVVTTDSDYAKSKRLPRKAARRKTAATWSQIGEKCCTIRSCSWAVIAGNRSCGVPEIMLGAARRRIAARRRPG